MPKEASPPDYATAFPRDKVNKLIIAFSAESWNAMQENLKERSKFSDQLAARLQEALKNKSLSPEALQKAFGGEAGRGKGGAAPDEQAGNNMGDVLAKGLSKALDSVAPAKDGDSVDTASGKAASDSSAAPPKSTPEPPPPFGWFPATVTLNDSQSWSHVGVRYKGQSSMSVRVTGSNALPMKLEFDRFEDDHPETKDQRFFGLQELMLANNYHDPSGMRDTIVYDVLREAGLPSIWTSAYDVFLDKGDGLGASSLGLYTAGEAIDDTGVKSFFGDDKGNIYEGEGRGAHLGADLPEDILKQAFQKKNNKKRDDYSDLLSLYAVLHDPIRKTDPPAWRAKLEAVFDTDAFLSWVGIAAIVGHWDSYGQGPHNFYLYNHNGRLVFFSWDHNLTLNKTPTVYLVTIERDNLEHAPLIGFLMEDPVYHARYVELVKKNFAGPVSKEALIAEICRGD